MSQSDLLSIQLFIGAAAIAVAGVAVTQAGWTHRLFVRLLFLLAALLTICAVFFNQLVTALPSITSYLKPIAGNSVAWFALMIASLILIFFLDFAVRKGWFVPSQRLLERIRNLAFKDEIVTIDGKYFENCTFHNVIFRYQGGQFHFVNATLTGTWRFETQALCALGTVAILKLLGGLDPAFAASWNPNLPAEYFSDDAN
jgi:hypothetical protein